MAVRLLTRKDNSVYTYTCNCIKGSISIKLQDLYFFIFVMLEGIIGNVFIVINDCLKYTV